VATHSACHYIQEDQDPHVGWRCFIMVLCNSISCGEYFGQTF